MVDLKAPSYQKIKEIWDENSIERTTVALRELFRDADGNFSVFELMKELGIMTILHDDQGETLSRFIMFKEDLERNYLVLSASRSVEEMRFDAACMLRKLIKKASLSGKAMSYNCSLFNDEFSREDKHFACALLMPRKKVLEFITRKDEFGNYLYLSDNREISLKSINAV